MKKVIYVLVCFSICISVVPIFGQNSIVEDWSKWELKYDKKNIRRSEKMFTDTSESFITIPSDYSHIRDFDVAGTPPTIDFGIVQGYKPWFLPVTYQIDSRTGGLWEGYGDVTKGPDGCFYFSIGDHRSYNGNAYIIRYDPAAKTQEIVVDLKKIIGWTEKDYADGKIHGDLDISPDGDMWFLTYFGPGPTREEWNTVYRGSWLLRYNIYSRKAENFGIPLEGSSWPYYNTDIKRGIFFGVAEHDGVVVAFDTKTKKMIYGGAPKKNISWHRRCTMLDHDTGAFYSSDTITYQKGDRYRGDQYFVRWDRRNNIFTRMKSLVPPNPKTGEKGPIRAHTSTKDKEGAFWCFSNTGTLFKFYPEEDKTEVIETNWGEEGIYTTNMCFSPKQRYIYYIPGASTRGFGFGTPVVQYDVTKKRKKVIAFIRDFYLENYGYGAGGSYGLELDKKGKSLFFYVTGGFSSKESDLKYFRPALFHVHIPESERLE